VKFSVEQAKQDWLEGKPVKVEPPARAYTRKQQDLTDDMRSPIDEFNEAHSVDDVILGTGLYEADGDRYHRIGSKEKAGILRCTQCKDGVERVYSFHGECALNDGKSHDAFDVMRLLEHGGDFSQALDWNPEITKHNQIQHKKDESKAKKGKGKGKKKGTSLLAGMVDYSINTIPPTEFVLDGMIQAGVVLIAGATGVGKTTQLVPLVARVTHLIDDKLKPLLRRDVIYVTEDKSQVLRILSSMAIVGEFTDPSEVHNRFKIVPASRMSVEDIVSDVTALMNHSYKNVGDNGEHNSMPLVVFDTANASFDLENESDNAEVGQLIAGLKESFEDIPIIIVAHTAKAIKRAEIADMSSRGAGAWEGDVNQVMYLCVEDDKSRWLDISTPKHRFEAVADGISFDYKSSDVTTVDMLNNPLLERVSHGVPTIIVTGDRKKAIEKRKEDAKIQLEQERQIQVMEIAYRLIRKGAVVTKTGLRERMVDCGGTEKARIINMCIDAGRLVLGEKVGNAHTLELPPEEATEDEHEESKGE